MKTAKHERYKKRNWWTKGHLVGKDAEGPLVTDTKVEAEE